MLLQRLATTTRAAVVSIPHMAAVQTITVQLLDLVMKAVFAILISLVVVLMALPQLKDPISKDAIVDHSSTDAVKTIVLLLPALITKAALALLLNMAVVLMGLQKLKGRSSKAVIMFQTTLKVSTNIVP